MSPELVFLTSIDDITTTTVKIDWILIGNLLPSGIVENFTIDVIAIGIVGEQIVREGQVANTLASCLVGSTPNKTLTVPGNATSALLTDLSMFSNCSRYNGVHEI